ncbi:unnamed protein product [Amaranthus hypochondriacus]
MATVRFKFRSSATFDSVDIGEQSSISIRDLKSLIVLKKHLNLSNHFDLVFSDFVSGEEYKDESVRIPTGSSVIIKRVPAHSSPLRTLDNQAGCFRDAASVNVIDPPALDTPHTIFSPNGNSLLNENGQKDNVAQRGTQEVLLRCQKLEGAQQSTPKDSSANERSTLVMPKPKLEEHMELERIAPVKHLSMENSAMPLELKCSLCRTFFKEAVMIPCCQHSFCAKCIRVALSELGKCPICSSNKCRPEDLLPNVSLRQAIQRFLESQLLLNGSENDLHRDAPDGESGIQVKEISSATAVPQRHMQLNRCTTWNRSNQTMQSKLPEYNHLADQHNHEPPDDFSEFQGENEPQSLAGTNEVNSCSNKGEGSRVIPGGGERNFFAPGRPNRGPRTCYMCGSPDHLIRDCPGHPNSNSRHWNGLASLPGAVSGYPPLCWPNTPPQVPFTNMYGGPGMMFYNANTGPISPYAFSSCAAYGGYPVSRPNGYMTMGGMALPAGNTAQHPRQADFLGPQNNANLQRNYDVALKREQNFQRDQNPNTPHDYTERGSFQSGDSFGKRSEGKRRSRDNSDGDINSNCNRQRNTDQRLQYGKDLWTVQSDRSSPERNVLDSRIRPREDKHEKLHGTVRRDDGKGVHHGHASSQRHYPLNHETSKRRRMEHGERKSDRHSHSRSRSSLERSYSGDGSRQRQRREVSSHRSRCSNKTAGFNGKEMHHDREKINYPDDYKEFCQSNKRKRFH